MGRTPVQAKQERETWIKVILEAGQSIVHAELIPATPTPLPISPRFVEPPKFEEEAEQIKLNLEQLCQVSCFDIPVFV
jgi:hypothetical protein